MKKILLGILKWYLLVMGALATCFILFAAIDCFNYPRSSTTKENEARPSQVQYVLSWADLRDCQIKEVLHSYVSDPNLYTGDHLTAYAIKVDGLAGLDLSAPNKTQHKWHRGDRLPPNLQAALKLIDGCRREIPWFPSHEELAAEKYYFFPWRLEFHGEQLETVQVIIASPDGGMVYYFDEQH